MGWWFGRKAAPDARPFVPAWLTNESAEVGFARSVEGLSTYVQPSNLWATFRAGNWEIGIVRCSSVTIAGQQVVGARAGAISSPSGGTSIDTQARTAIDLILTAMRQHGLIET